MPGRNIVTTRWEWEQEKSIQTDLVKRTHFTLVFPCVLVSFPLLPMFNQVYKHLGLYSLDWGQQAGRSSFSKSIPWDFPGGPAVGLQGSKAGSVSSIPGQGTKIPRATCHTQKFKKKKKKSICFVPC